jgi:hypothetical protein
MGKLRIRASRADLIDDCGQAAIDDGSPRISFDSDPARLGRAVHDGVATWLRSGKAPVVDELCDMHRVESEESRRDATWLISQAIRRWHQIENDYPKPIVEQQFSFENDWLILDGTGDVVSIADPQRVAVLDWKTGRKGSYYWQRIMYGWLILQWHQTAREVLLRNVWLRTGDDETIVMTRESITHAWNLFASKLRNSIKGNTFSPGDCCRHCDRRHSCRARRTYMNAAIASVREITDNETGEIELSRIEERLDLLDSISEYRDEFRARLKMYMQDTGKPIPISNDRELYLNTPTTRTIHPRPAWDAIWQAVGCSNDKMAGVLAVSITSLKRTVMDAAERGNKTRAWETLLELLRANHAIEEQPGQPRLLTRLRKEPVDDRDPSDSASV